MIPNPLHPSGVLDGEAAGRLLSALTGEQSYTLDFSDVEAVHFAALRKLMGARRAGLRFCIINASDSVAERFFDSGVSAYIDVCRKPKPLDISQYEEFGASFMSKAFNHGDGDAMMKLYGPRVPLEAVAREKAVARAVMQFGLPTPLVGTIYSDGKNTALDFERIPGKRSFSRIIAEEPEKLDAITRRFARMCRQLHATPCDTALFEDRRIPHREAVSRCRELSDGEKARILAFVDSIPDATTCLHGDMQPSNVITTGLEDLWIDLGEFGYGHPMLDIAMLYFLLKWISEEQARALFHLGQDELARMWDIFMEEYAMAYSRAAKEAFVQQVIPYAALHMVYLGVNVGFVPGMLDFVRQVFETD